MSDTGSFQRGDRVALSGYGRELFDKTPDRVGTVLELARREPGSFAPDAYWRIQWDDLKVPVTLHGICLKKVEAR
jgi:hypothetical protein